jgi:transposase
MEQAMQQRRRRRAFTATYKAEVVELCRKGERSIAQVARDLGLTETSVRRWVEQAEVDAGRRPGLTSSEHEELVQLRREVRVLREERDILKRATAFFARETR